MKTWKVWLFSSICFLFVGIMNIMDEKYLSGSAFTLLGLSYIFLSLSYYKKNK